MTVNWVLRRGGVPNRVAANPVAAKLVNGVSSIGAADIPASMVKVAMGLAEFGRDPTLSGEVKPVGVMGSGGLHFEAICSSPVLTDPDTAEATERIANSPRALALQIVISAL